MLHCFVEVLLLLEADLLKNLEVAMNSFVCFNSSFEKLLLVEQSLSNFGAQSFIVIAEFELCGLEVNYLWLQE